jgi:hypothetical protein
LFVGFAPGCDRSTRHPGQQGEEDMAISKTSISVGATALAVGAFGGIAIASGGGTEAKPLASKPIVVADIKTEHRFVHVRKHLPAPHPVGPRPVAAAGSAPSASYAAYTNPSTTQASGPSNNSGASQSYSSSPAPTVHTHSSSGSGGTTGSYGDDKSGNAGEQQDGHDDNHGETESND